MHTDTVLTYSQDRYTWTPSQPQLQMGMSIIPSPSSTVITVNVLEQLGHLIYSLTGQKILVLWPGAYTIINAALLKVHLCDPSHGS
jgi:hypothetical protein